MNEDDFLDISPYEIPLDIVRGSDEGETLTTDSSGAILDDLDIKADSIFHVPHERSVLIQSQQRVSPLEFSRISWNRREAFIDHVKEKALQGMLEQADLVNAISYEEETDPMTHDKIITAKLKVIIDE